MPLGNIYDIKRMGKAYTADVEIKHSVYALGGKCDGDTCTLPSFGKKACISTVIESVNDRPIRYGNAYSILTLENKKGEKNVHFEGMINIPKIKSKVSKRNKMEKVVCSKKDITFSINYEATFSDNIDIKLE